MVVGACFLPILFIALIAWTSLNNDMNHMAKSNRDGASELAQQVRELAARPA